MESGDSKPVTGKEGYVPPGQIHFIHPCNVVYVLLVFSSTILVLLSVAAIWVWSVRGHGNKAYLWLVFYSIAVLSLVVSFWSLRLVRAVVYFVRVYGGPRRAQVLVTPDITASVDE